MFSSGLPNRKMVWWGDTHPHIRSTENDLKPSTKYHTDARSECEPGSRGRILNNLKHITKVRELEEAELAAYMNAEGTLVKTVSASHRFSLSDLDEIHRLFLGGICAWAGSYRTVNISKGGFPFASAFAIPQAMKDFEREVLRVLTPCNGVDEDAVAAQIAPVHAEFLLIHPYREGNGRTARLLATLSAYQAGMPGIDFGFIKSRGKEFDGYVHAIHAALDADYRPMQAIIKRGLRLAQRLT